MARTVHDANLGTREARRRLPIQAKPHWREISQGRHVGYRRRGKSGTWIARLYLGTGRYAEGRLGTADDTHDADGIEVLSWPQAQQKAADWFVQKLAEDRGAETPRRGAVTVGDALDAYLAWYKLHRKSYADTKQYVEAHIRPALGRTELNKLTAGKIKAWHQKLAETPARRRTRKGAPQNYAPDPTTEDALRSRKVTANRVLTILKAALNKAYADGLVTSDASWKKAKRFKAVDAARPRFLDTAEAIRLINASEPEFRPLVQGALLTGARYGELTRLKVRDFRNGKLQITDSKSGKPRWISLTSEGRTFFEQQTIGRSGDQLIFWKTGRNGKEAGWGRSHQIEPMQRACEHASVEPLGFHQLRHTYASLCLMSGMPMLVLAKNLGHRDTRMVEQHYGHLIPSFEDQMIEQHAPRFGVVSGDRSVVAL